MSWIPTGGWYLWLQQIHKKSLREGKKLAGLPASLFSFESVWISVWGCRTPLLSPGRGQGATSSASGARVTVTLGTESAPSSCKSIRSSVLGFRGQLCGISWWRFADWCSSLLSKESICLSSLLNIQFHTLTQNVVKLLFIYRVKLNKPTSWSGFDSNRRGCTVWLVLFFIFLLESGSGIGHRNIHWIKSLYYVYLRSACDFQGHRKDKKVMKEKNLSPFTVILTAIEIKKRKEPFLIIPSSLPILTCAREHQQSPLRCCSHLNIYGVCFLYTFPSERNGTVCRRHNGMGSSGWLLQVAWLPVEDVQRALPIFSKFPGVSQHLSLTLSLMRSSGGGGGGGGAVRDLAVCL